MASRIGARTLKVAVNHARSRLLAPVINPSYSRLIETRIRRIKAGGQIGYVQAVVVVIAQTDVMEAALGTGESEVGEVVNGGGPPGSVNPVVTIVHGLDPTGVLDVITGPGNIGGLQISHRHPLGNRGNRNHGADAAGGIEVTNVPEIAQAILVHIHGIGRRCPVHIALAV